MQFDRSKSSLEALTESCGEDKVDPAALAQLLNLPQLRRIRRSETQLDEIARASPGTILIKFMAPIQSEDTQIFQVKYLKHYLNVTTKPMLVMYTGPTYLMYNSTSNCTKGVVPDGLKVRDSCEEKDYHDPKLTLWSRTVTTEPLAPQILQTNRGNHIYCLYHDIKLDTGTYKCPPYPMWLPHLQRFSIGTLKHDVNMTLLNATSYIPVTPIKHFNSSMHEDDLEDQLRLIEHIRLLNEKLEEHQKPFRFEGEFWQSSQFWTSVFIPLVSIAFPVILLLTRHCMGDAQGREHQESVTVVNNISPETSNNGHSQCASDVERATQVVNQYLQDVMRPLSDHHAYKPVPQCETYSYPISDRARGGVNEAMRDAVCANIKKEPL